MTSLPDLSVPDNHILVRCQLFQPTGTAGVELISANADFRAQADPDNGDIDGLLSRYPNAPARNFDGQPGITELDAMIAYLQMLGTMVDFSTFEPDASR